MRRKIVKNLTGYAYSQGVTLFAQLALVPFYVGTWGLNKYGEWLVIVGIPTVLALMELGVAQASATRASMASGRGDTLTMRRSLDTAMAFTLGAVIVLIVVGVLIGLLFPWSSILNLKLLPESAAGEIFIAMIVSLAGTMLAGPIAAWLKAVDRTAGAAFWMANRRAAEFGVTAVGLLLGATPSVLALMIMVTSLLTTVMFYWVAVRQSPIGAVTFKNAEFVELRKVFLPAISCMAYPCALTITNQAGVQFLNILTDSATVATFVMCRTIARLLMQVGIVMNNAMRPEVSRLIGRGDFAHAISLVRKGTLAAIALVLVAFSLIGLFGPDIVRMWSGGEAAIGQVDMIMIAAHSAANVLWYTPATILYARNMHTRTSYWYLIFSTCAVGAWWIALDSINPLAGASMMMLAPEMLMIMFIWLQRNRFISKD